MAIRYTRKFRRFKWYVLPSSFISVRLAFGLLIGEILLGIVGFHLLEGYKFLDAFFMTIITISTVGYTEVQPLGASGKVFASILILLNIGIFAYFVSVFGYFIVQGEIFKKMHTKLVERHIKRLEEHVILCGYGKYGQEIYNHLKVSNIPLVIIDNDEEKITEIQEIDEKILYINGDATEEGVLQDAGVDNARAIITALPNDAENLFTVLTARQLNSDVYIISKAIHDNAVQKIHRAGADQVIMPDQLSGYLMASLVSKPRSLELFFSLTSGAHSDFEFAQLNDQNMPEAWIGKSIRELNFRATTGVNIVACQKDSGKGDYIINPDADYTIEKGDTLIVLGNNQQLRNLADLLEK